MTHPMNMYYQYCIIVKYDMKLISFQHLNFSFSFYAFVVAATTPKNNPVINHNEAICDVM